MAEPDYRRNLTLADLDEHGCLKITFGLWLTMVFLCRHLILLLLGATSSLANFTYGQASASYGVIFSHPWFLLASAPALVVLVAGMRRTPSAPAPLRAIWHFGAQLLILAAVLDLVVLGVLIGIGHFDLESTHILQAFLDAICLIYLTRTKRVWDTFADFPAREGNKGSG